MGLKIWKIDPVNFSDQLLNELCKKKDKIIKYRTSKLKRNKKKCTTSKKIK